MGAMKELFGNQIEKIERETGYDFFFLQDRVFELMEDGLDADESIDAVHWWAENIGWRTFDQDRLEKYISANFCDTSEFDLDAIIDKVSFVEDNGKRYWRGNIDVDEIIARNAWDRKDC